MTASCYGTEIMRNGPAIHTSYTPRSITDNRVWSSVTLCGVCSALFTIESASPYFRLAAIVAGTSEPARLDIAASPRHSITVDNVVAEWWLTRDGKYSMKPYEMVELSRM
jgi:hypothetical protein